jgi:hypothetical protein
MFISLALLGITVFKDACVIKKVAEVKNISEGEALKPITVPFSFEAIDVGVPLYLIGY